MTEIVLDIPTPGDFAEDISAGVANVWKNSVRAYLVVTLLAGVRNIPVSEQFRKVFDSMLRVEFEAKGWAVSSFNSQMSPMLVFTVAPVDETMGEDGPAEPNATLVIGEDPNTAAAMIRPEPMTPRIKKSVGETTL